MAGYRVTLTFTDFYDTLVIVLRYAPLLRCFWFNVYSRPTFGDHSCRWDDYVVKLPNIFDFQGHVFVLHNFLCLSFVKVMGQGNRYIYYMLCFIISEDESCIIIIIIIIIIILVITFMQGRYNYIPETNHVSRVYSVTVVLYLQFVLHVMLFRPWNVLHFYISIFHSMCAVTDMVVFVVLISCFPGMLLSYCLSDSEMVPVAPVITGITFALTFHMRWVSIIMSLH